MTTLKRSGSVAVLTLKEPMRGIQLHDLRRAELEGPSPRLVWLLNLRAHQELEAQQHVALVTALSAIRETLGRVPAQVAARLDEVKAIAVELGLAIAREVVGESLDRGHVDPGPIVARCLKQAVTGSDSTRLGVVMHPMDLSLVLNAIELDPELRLFSSSCSFDSDAGLQRGAVRVTTDAGRLLYDPREVLERICTEIRKETTK